MTEITQLWKKFEEHYGGKGNYQFGYRDREGLLYSFSVLDRRTGRARIDQVGIGLHIDEYKKTWYRLMKEFEAPGVSTSSAEQI